MTRSADIKVREEAELWLARRLQPAVSEIERAAFEQWREQDLRNAQAYARAERLWDELAMLKSSSRLQELAAQVMADTSAVSDERTAEVPAQAADPLRRSFSSRLLPLAASVAAIAIAVTAAHTIGVDSPAEVRTFATALGEQRSEVLTDGTMLRLNTNSVLDVRMSRKRREVTLESGEAAFEVAKDSQRPFVVAAGGGTITAIGTHFQVRNENGNVIVTLLEGRVQLARPQHRETEWLDPGQQARFTAGASGIVRRNVDLQALTSWMSGRLEFRGLTLGQAVAEVNRYSARTIRIGDAALGRIAVSGTFRTGDVDAVAAALEAAFPVRAQIGDGEIVLLPR